MAVLDTGVKEKTLAAIKTLYRLGTVRAVYIFGSQVEGYADEWSDIDFAAFMDGVENWDMKKHAHIGAQIMVEAGSDVEVHLFPASSLESPGRGSFAEWVLRHGVCIVENRNVDTVFPE